VGAKVVRVPDATDQMVIQYKNNGIFYEGVLEFNVQTFIFAELSFGSIPEPTIKFTPI
jgi:hypothetical protein